MSSLQKHPFLSLCHLKNLSQSGGLRWFYHCIPVICIIFHPSNIQHYQVSIILILGSVRILISTFKPLKLVCFSFQLVLMSFNNLKGGPGFLFFLLFMTHMKFRAKPGNFIGLSYVGQSDLHITYYGLPHVWYTPGKQQV